MHEVVKLPISLLAVVLCNCNSDKVRTDLYLHLEMSLHCGVKRQAHLPAALTQENNR